MNEASGCGTPHWLCGHPRVKRSTGAWARRGGPLLGPPGASRMTRIPLWPGCTLAPPLVSIHTGLPAPGGRPGAGCEQWTLRSGRGFRPRLDRTTGRPCSRCGAVWSSRMRVFRGASENSVWAHGEAERHSPPPAPRASPGDGPEAVLGAGQETPAGVEGEPRCAVSCPSALCSRAHRPRYGRRWDTLSQRPCQIRTYKIGLSSL